MQPITTEIISHPITARPMRHWPESVLICVMGFAATIGEQMNIYFSFASKLYVFSGTLLLFLLILRKLPLLFSAKRAFAQMGSSFWCLFIIIAIITLFRTFTGEVALSAFDIIEKLKTPLFMLFGLVLCTDFLDNNQNLNLFCWAYLIGFILMIPFGTTGDFTSAYRFVGTYANPNTYGVDSFFAFFLGLYLLKSKKMWIIKLLIMGLVLASLLRTGSRGALMSLMVGISFIYLFTKNFRQKFVFIILGLFAILGLFLYSHQDTTGIMERLFEESYMGNIRLSIWQAYFHNLDKFFWFGADESVIATIHHFTPHNVFLGVLVRYGIFALLSYIIFMLCAIKDSFIRGKSEAADFPIRVLSSLVFALVVSGMTMENINNRTTWIIYAVVLYNAYSTKQKGNITLD